MNNQPPPMVLGEIQNKPSSSQTSKLSTSSMVLKCAYDFSYTSIKENINPSIKLKLSDIGYFDSLPDEILIKILSKIKIEDLTNFCLTNKILCEFIIDIFLSSKSGLNILARTKKINLAITTINKDSLFDLFTSIGRLMKKSTFVFPTSQRISVLVSLIKNSYGLIHLDSFDKFTFLNMKLIFKLYERMINQLVKGWGDFECAKVYKELKKNFQIETHMDQFLMSSLGSKQKQELLIRFFYRMICNSTVEESVDNLKEKLEYLSVDLKDFTLEQIAKVIIVIFGPIVSTNSSIYSLPFIAWWDLTDTNFVKVGFEDLGLVLSIFYDTNETTGWDKNYVVEIVKNIVNTPARWTSLNIAILLYYSGEKLALQYFQKKFSETIENAVENLCYLIIVTYKFYKKLSSVAKMVEILVDQFGSKLIEQIVQSFASIILEAEPNDEEDENDTLTREDIITAQLQLMRLLMFKIHHLNKFH